MLDPSDPATTVIVTDTIEVARHGARLVATGEVCGVIFFDDLPNGAYVAHAVVGIGHEHRFKQFREIVRRSSERIGFVEVDPARLVAKRGEA